MKKNLQLRTTNQWILQTNGHYQEVTIGIKRLNDFCPFISKI